MLNARFLANLSDDLVELYSQLEFEIKKDIFRRLNKLQKVTDATVYQMEVLQQVGGLKKDIQHLVAKYDEIAKKQLLELYTEAMQKAYKNDLKYYPLAKRELSKTQSQMMNASVDRYEHLEDLNKTFFSQSRQFQEVYESLVRMTLTVADATEKKFLKEVNNAYMKVSTGAFSWDSAYKVAINNLAKDGVKTVLYTGSGKIIERSIESATRMNILTGINQSATEQTLENCEVLGTTLVEVSAHIGARPDHAEWQGKVYSLKDGGESYIDENGQVRFAEDFQKVCRLGEADGICGINCRHSFYPYFAGRLAEDENGNTKLIKGMQTEYSKGELDEMKDERVYLYGQKVTPYEAEQELRLCERVIRTCKSQIVGYETVDGNYEAEIIKERERLGAWQKRAKLISEESGIQRKYINEYIGTKDGKQPKGIIPKI